MPQKDKPRILLINPPIYDFALYDLYLKPYGLWKMEKAFHESGYETTVIDAMDTGQKEMLQRYGQPKRKNDGSGKFFRQVVNFPAADGPTGRRFSRYGIDKDLLAESIKDSHADIIGITSGMTYWYPGIVETVSICKDDKPNRPVIIGGTSAALIPEFLEQQCGGDAATGRNREELNRVLEKFDLPRITDEIREEYNTAMAKGSPSAVIRLNTGCPYRCRYCASALIEKTFKEGNGDERSDFVYRLHKEAGVRHFAFYDDALLCNRERVLHPFLKKLIKMKIDVHFYLPNAVHVRYLDEETLDLMKMAGFQEIRMGFEAADRHFHEKMGNKDALENFRDVITMIRQKGFDPKKSAVYIIAGLPGQSAEEVEASIRYAAEAGARCRIASYSPVPHSSLWQESIRLSSYPIETEPLYQNNTIFPMEHDLFTKTDLNRLKDLCTKTPFI